ncbi:MAG: restriction endonuclease [Prevotella sp.]|nr:restriction endonuclease [Prevotella sp.]
MWKKGIKFEEKCISKLRELGFQHISKTPISGDYGADIEAYFNKMKCVFQCKNHEKRQGVRAVQEILGAKTIYEAKKCVVISSSGFTKNAYTLAKANSILLLKADDLFKSEDIKTLLDDTFIDVENANIITHDYNIIEEFYKIKEKIGHIPTLSELDKTLRYKINKVYGGYTIFINEIGERLKRSAPTREIIKEEYIRIRTLLRKVPTANDIKANTHLPYNQFHTYPLTKLQKECGDIPNCDRSVTNVDLINEYLDLEKKLGHKPNGQDIDKYGKHGSHLYIRRFGSLKKFYSLPEISAKELLKEPLNKKEIVAFYLMLRFIFNRQQIPLTYGNIKKLSCGEYKPFPISAIEYKYKNFGDFCMLLENNESVKELENNFNKLINNFIRNTDL